MIFQVILPTEITQLVNHTGSQFVVHPQPLPFFGGVINTRAGTFFFVYDVCRPVREYRCRKNTSPVQVNMSVQPHVLMSSLKMKNPRDVFSVRTQDTMELLQKAGAKA